MNPEVNLREKEIKILKRKLSQVEEEKQKLLDTFRAAHETFLWKITRPLRFFLKALKLLRTHWKKSRRLPWKEAFKKLSAHLRPEPAIKFAYSPEPIVSIIIPVYGKLKYTLRCLTSISKFPPYHAFEVIVMDDASPDNSYEVLKKIRGLQVIKNTTNLGFIRNCNKAAKLARGEFLLFLNNDTTVFPNWCDALLETFDEYPDTGLAGSKFIFSKNKLQEAGSIIWKDGSAWNYGCKDNPYKPEYNYLKETDYCSGASICLRKSLFEKVGGFDEHYLPAYCEDSDLAFKIREAGDKVRYQPFSVVQHYRGISHGKFTFSGTKTYQVKNQQKLYARWKDILQKEHFNNGENVFLARDRSAKKPVILFIDYAVPKYDQNAGDKTIDLYLRFFVNKNFNVKLWPQYREYDPVYTTRYQKMGIEVFYQTSLFDSFKKWLEKNGPYINYIFISRPEVAEEFLPVIKEKLKQLSSIKLLYYGHDIHHLRMKAQQSLNTENNQSLALVKFMENLEKNIWSNMDVIYYPSETEYDYVKNRIKTPVHYIPALYYPSDTAAFLSSLPPFSQRKDLLFVGNFRHTPNLDGILWFIKEILPIIHKSSPDIMLYIVGTYPPDELIAQQNNKIILTGYISNETLEDYYLNCRLSIAPLRYGAGVKGKVVDALYYGLPVVTTSFGAQGIPEASTALALTDEAIQMAQMIIDLYNNPEEWTRLSSTGRDIITRYYSEAAVSKIFALDIPEVLS